MHKWTSTVASYLFKINKVSYNSPIARGMIGKEEGDEIIVQAPSGAVEYEITEVKYI